MLLFSLLNLRITKNAVNIGAYGLKFIIVISEIVVYPKKSIAHILKSLRVLDI